MNIHINTPEGTRDRLFSECLERRQVQSALVELFRRRGYTEVITPELVILIQPILAFFSRPQMANLSRR